ncbi:uncharacterized protein ATNIH1004_001781 [Aspergillus tanneri]|nr:uncharacterized protein ATNIH1004_001781 [Aspergillus tanneri]KAA8652872.1 hypothetical protein ATNIH1004_001781 [Aspergillus tanneri]
MYMGGCHKVLEARNPEARPALEVISHLQQCAQGYGYVERIKQCQQIIGYVLPARHLDPFTAPSRIILGAIETFGEGVASLIKGRPCQGVSKIAIPGVHSVIRELLTSSEGKLVIEKLEREITAFLNNPGIHETWEFLNEPLTDIPVIGPAIKSIGNAEAWIFKNIVPAFAQEKLKTCIDDGLRHPTDDPFFFILGAAVNMVQHPTILDLLLAIPGVGEMSGAVKAAEEAAKFAEAAKASGIVEEAIEAENAAERAAELAKAARGTQYEGKVAQAAHKAKEAANDAHYWVEHAEGPGPKQNPKQKPNPVEGDSKPIGDATAVEVPHVPNEGVKVVEDAELKASNQAELDEALENTWSKSDEAAQANCKRSPGLKCLKNWGKPEYRVFDDVPTLQDLVGNIQKYGQVEKGNGLFYSSLDGQNGVKLSTEHYKNYIQKTTGRKGFAIDRVTDKNWSRAQMNKMKTPAMVDRFGRRLSQAFAETTQGDVYFFTRSEFDGTTFPATSVWGGWEYPALTRNPRVTKIIQVDPFKKGDLGHTIWTPDKGPSPNAPKSGNVA